MRVFRVVRSSRSVGYHSRVLSEKLNDKCFDLNLTSTNESLRNLAGVAAAAVQGKGGLGQEKEEQEDEE